MKFSPLPYDNGVGIVLAPLTAMCSCSVLCYVKSRHYPGKKGPDLGIPEYFSPTVYYLPIAEYNSGMRALF